MSTTNLFANNSMSLIPPEEKRHLELMRYLSVLLGFIITSGVFANIINIIVFSRKAMRTTSTFRFLFFLSCVDLLVLIIIAQEALVRFEYRYQIRSISNFVCKVHTFLTYFLTHTSSIILMVISIDRALVISNTSFLSILNPLNLFGCCFTKKKPKAAVPTNNGSNTNNARKSTHLCCFNKSSIHNVDIIVISIIVILALLNSHYLLFLNLNISVGQNLLMSEENIQLYNMSVTPPYELHCYAESGSLYRTFLDGVWLWTDFFVYSILPFIVMGKKKINLSHYHYQ